jgi:predicted  nucleic acid-binding Zn-ribbon protein
VARQTLENRVATLEQQIQALVGLPERMVSLESQFQQLRSDVREEFAALRMEIRTGDLETRRFIRVLHEDVISRIAAIGEGRS